MSQPIENGGAFNPDRAVSHEDVTDGPGLREDGHIIACGNGGDDDGDCSPECLDERRVWWAKYESQVLKP